MDTEDICQLHPGDAVPAPLLLHVALVTRNPSIETMLVPVCERCYQDAIDRPSARLITDMLPRHLAHRVKFWTAADYDASWFEVS